MVLLWRVAAGRILPARWRSRVACLGSFQNNGKLEIEERTMKEAKIKKCQSARHSSQAPGIGVASRGRPPSAKRRVVYAVLAAIGAIGASLPSYAVEFDTGTDVKLRWDNTVKYSMAYRLHNPSDKIAGGDAGIPPPGPQLDDGDRNFNKGVVSNRFDLFSEFDASYQQVGMRVSGAAWYDTVYNTSNDNKSATINSLSVPAGQFTNATRDLMGRKAEFLDAFAYFKNDPESETPFTVRVGKHTVLYGESLFFGANGIAQAQAPVDLIKLLAVPGSQFKEIIRPVNQASTQVQVTPSVSIGAYYQFQWEANRLPASGSYLSDADFVGAGAESVLGFRHGADINAKNSGQGGVAVRFKPPGGVEYGLYAARYHDKGPQIYLDPISVNYRLLYAEDVNTYGASFSTTFGPSNVSGEVSFRDNAPLVSDPQIDLGFQGNNNSNPLYAVGKTAHAQVSSITLFGKSALWDGGVFLNELAWNRTLSITKNPLALDQNTTRDAWAFRMILEPQYFQVLSGVDLSVPIGLGYNPSGRSSAVFKFNGGTEHAGDFSIGATANYHNSVKIGLNFVHYFGKEDAFLKPNTSSVPGPFSLSFAQSLHDRDFISFSVQTTF
jgi:hypothetical protein